jgi:hypothetical protein
MVGVLTDTHYIPGEKPAQNRPLERYLPPIYRQVAPTWLANKIPKHSWLLDPFGASPDLVIEAAEQGYRFLVSANNPVTRFMLEILARRPTLSDFQAALAQLASQQVGQERLEPHIKSMYETTCANCNRPVVASEFIWRREESAPFAKVYDCPYCGDSGERPTVTLDVQKTESYSKTSLHKARAMERVAPLHDPDRQHVEDALSVYLPRAIYAIVTIINKLNSIPTTDPNHSLVAALLLLAFDRANTLWLYPKERQRPKQLVIPPQYREHNIWLALESAAELWQSTGPPVPIVRWPELPPDQGGICLYEGRIKELATDLSRISIQAILTAFPRTNQAFWTLSALWAGWLWGHGAVEPFKGVLRRRRYDWGWHTTAIQSALNSLSDGIESGTPYFGLVSEIEPGFLSSVVLGARLANLELKGLALRSEDSLAQIQWQHPPSRQMEETEELPIGKAIESQVQAYLLKQRGEPSPYIYIHAAGLTGAVQHPLHGNFQSPHDFLSQIQSEIQQATSFRKGFLRYGGSDKSAEVGLWWTSLWQNQVLPLADRTEITLVHHLTQHPDSTLSEIDRAVCRELPGIAPPEAEMLQICMQSYGHPVNQDEDRWRLHERESPGKRRQDMENITTLIVEMGKRLGYEVFQIEGFPPIIQWYKTPETITYQFLISASALLGKFIQPGKRQWDKAIMVIPGSRANLIAYKIKQNPYYTAILNQDWQFVKYRHIRLLSESPTLQDSNLEEQLSLDPLTYTQPQIRLL